MRSGRDPVIWIVPLILSALGIVVILSLTTVRLGDGSVSFVLGQRQAQWLAVALICMLISSALPLDFWWNRSGLFLASSWILTWLTLIPGIGTGGGGASRWIKLGPISFQPLELLVFFLMIHLCKIYTRKQLKSFRSFSLTLLLIFIAAIPVLLQPDLGGTLLLFFLAMGIYVQAYGFLLPLTSAILLSPVFVFLSQKGYRQRRIVAWLDPWSDPSDVGYQTIQGLIAFANGGFWGTGLGKAVQRSRFLPAAHTDFVFAAIAETLGVIGSVTILSLFLLWFFRIYCHFRQAEDSSIALLLWAGALSIAIPLIVNIGGISNAIPMTGMPLPFLSYGGSSLVISWLKIGLILRALRELYDEKRGVED